MTTPFINDNDTLLAAKEGDKDAMEKIVSSNMGLVKSIALRFVGRGVELEDLIQIGSVGMIKAVRGFKAEKNCRFTTYAVPLILGEIKRFLRDDGWIKISREMRSHAASIFRFTEEYEKREGKSPTIETICAALSISEEKAVLAMESSRPALSLYGSDEESDFSLEKIVGEDHIEEEVVKIALREAVSSLPKEEKHLIELRYFRSLTQEQTARLLGLTQVKVSREEKRILKKMREEFFSAS